MWIPKYAKPSLGGSTRARHGKTVHNLLKVGEIDPLWANMNTSTNSAYVSIIFEKAKNQCQIH